MRARGPDSPTTRFASPSPLDGPRHAVGFLTRIPVPFGDHEPPRLAAAVPWFPLVGAGVGAIGGGVLALVDLLPGAGPAGVAAACAIAAMIVTTGALHEDGLADTADGMGVLGDRPRRLTVLRDSRIGTFGGAALMIWLLVCWSALSALAVGDAVLALVAAGALSRWANLVHVLVGRPARPDGSIHALVLRPPALLAATVVSVAIALLTLGGTAGAVCVAAAALVGVSTSWGARRAFGGITGDTCGAASSLALATVLVLALAFVA